MFEEINIVSIGGAGGQANVLKSLAGNNKYKITAICTAADSGQDTGKIVKENVKYNVNGSLGDIGKCLCALSPDRLLAEDLMHRFESGSRQGQSVKNSLYLGLIQRHGQLNALRRMHQILRVPSRHKVLPVTFSKTHLKFKLVDGTRLSDETVLDSLSKQTLWNLRVHRLSKVWLNPVVDAAPEVLMAIAKANWIIISPGDLYTSIIPVLLVKGVAEAIAKSSANLMVILNLMTKIGETDGYAAADFIRHLKTNMQNRIPDVVVCNNSAIPEDSLRRYKRKEHKVAVVANNLSGTEFENVKLISSNLWAKTPEGYIVHDPKKLKRVIKKVFSQTNRLQK